MLVATIVWQRIKQLNIHTHNTFDKVSVTGTNCTICFFLCFQIHNVSLLDDSYSYSISGLLWANCTKGPDHSFQGSRSLKLDYFSKTVLHNDILYLKSGSFELKKKNTDTHLVYKTPTGIGKAAVQNKSQILPH